MVGGQLFDISKTRLPRSDVKENFPGELRVQLCRCKNNGITGGTIPIANAGASHVLLPPTPGSRGLGCPVAHFSLCKCRHLRQEHRAVHPSREPGHFQNV